MIILTQACDLANEKTARAIVAVVHGAVNRNRWWPIRTEVKNSNSFKFLLSSLHVCPTRDAPKPSYENCANIGFEGPSKLEKEGECRKNRVWTCDRDYFPAELGCPN